LNQKTALRHRHTLLVSLMTTEEKKERFEQTAWGPHKGLDPEKNVKKKRSP